MGNGKMKVNDLLFEQNDEIIRYAETYEIITPESAEYGEPEERGFIDENLESDYEDMVDLLEGTEPSEMPPSPRSWYTKYEVDYDYETGARENRSYHPKTERDGELMLQAWKETN